MSDCHKYNIRFTGCCVASGRRRQMTDPLSAKAICLPRLRFPSSITITTERFLLSNFSCMVFMSCRHGRAFPTNPDCELSISCKILVPFFRCRGSSRQSGSSIKTRSHVSIKRFLEEGKDEGEVLDKLKTGVSTGRYLSCLFLLY